MPIYLEEYNSSGQVIVFYVYGNDLISQQRGSDLTFYLVDGLGSTRVLTDGSRNVVSTYTYEAFGELISSTGSVENKYRFAGEQFDEGLGDYYLRQRYYDSEIGRFTRRDTYEGRINEPVTLHKYLYTNGNPVMFVDPSGLFSAAEAQVAASIGNTLNSIEFQSAQEFFVAVTTNEQPTPKSIGLGIIFDLTLITLVPVAILALPLVIRQGIAGLVRSTGYAKLRYCDTCALKVKESLIKAGIKGTHIRIQTTSSGKFTNKYQGNIFDEGINDIISSNGYHEAIVVK